MNKNNYCVIMAGGIGSRFWPLSRSQKPKQFLDIMGSGKTLLRQTFERFARVIPAEQIYVVTSECYRELTCQELGIPESQVLAEPMRRNTAPCIAYANFRIFRENPEARIVVTPADHLIKDEDAFQDVLVRSLEFVDREAALLTIGIKPSRPDTGYGYIQFNKEATHRQFPDFRQVKTFTEKPALELAKEFFECGEFLWNSGIFFWSLPSIMEAFDKHLPEVNALFRSHLDQLGTPAEIPAIEDIYVKSKSISIDYAVMEKSDNVYVLPSDFGWSDIGTWGSLHSNLQRDASENAVVGENVFLYDSSRSLVHIPEDKLAVIQGVDDLIVVMTDDVLLICKKEEEQRIRDFVTEVKLRKGEHFL
jgi:mannose-1-phosphate guanylyltransferase